MPDPRPADDPDLGAAEAALIAAMRLGDVAALDALLADDLVFTGPDGGTLGKQDDLEAHRTGATRFLALDVVSTRADAAPPEGASETIADVVLDLGGEPLALRLRWERAWRVLDGRWQIVRASAAVVDPD